MNCKDVQVLLNDYIDGSLTDTNAEVVNIHCEICESCSASLNKLRTQRDLLAGLPLPPPSKDFERRVIDAAVENSRPGRMDDNKLYMFAAVAMIVAVVIFLDVLRPDSSAQRNSQLLSVGDEVQTIKVAIESEQTLDSVTMQVELSDNLELSGFGNRKQIHWQTRINKGVNIISLPIVGIAQGKGNITTRVLLNGQEKVMRVQTQYKAPDSVLFKNNVISHG